MRRRAFVVWTSGVLSVLAGCQTGAPSDSAATVSKATSTRKTQSSRTRSEDPTTPNNRQLDNVCRDEDPTVDRFDSWDVRYGTAFGFELTVTQKRLHHDEPLTVELRNINENSKATGVKNKFDIEYQTDSLGSEWRSIYRFSDNLGFSDDVVSHEPGEGFVWKVRTTAEGMKYRQDFHVCDPLSTGQYRFIYWGIGDPDEALAIRFEIIDGGTLLSMAL